jgi:hypothetical protein
MKMSDDGSPEAAAEFEDALGDMERHMSESARDCAVAVKKSLTTALDQKYTSEALAKDLAAFWARGVRDMARGWTDLAKLATAIAALKPTPPAPPTGSTSAHPAE